MLKQVWFHIHGKSPELTTKIMTIILKKFKFIKVFLVLFFILRRVIIDVANFNHFFT